MVAVVVVVISGGGGCGSGGSVKPIFENPYTKHTCFCISSINNMNEFVNQVRDHLGDNMFSITQYFDKLSVNKVTKLTKT